MPAGDVEAHPFLRRPNHTIAVLTAPMMASLVVEPLAGIVDTAFVERLGAAPASALGAATVLLSGGLWVFNFLGIGTQTEVAREAGRGSAGAREASTLALALALVLGVGAALVVWPLLPAAANWMSDVTAVRVDTISYLEIRLLGVPAVFLTVAAFGVLRGAQDMVSPMWVAGAITVVNIGLDSVLVFGAGPIPPLGIAGAAWATTVAQVAGAAWAVTRCTRKFPLTRHLAWNRARALFRVGLDMSLRTGALLVFLIVATRAALQAGVQTGAAHQALRQVWTLIAFLLDAFAATAQTLIAFFIGGMRVDIARRVARICALWGLGAGAITAALLLAVETPVAALLVPASARAVFSSAWWVCAAAQPLNAVAFVTDGIHWGTGDFGYLRNAMLIATAVGIGLVVALDTSAPHALRNIWAITAAWITIRALFGVVRIWPGSAGTPLAPTTSRAPAA